MCPPLLQEGRRVDQRWANMNCVHSLKRASQSVSSEGESSGAIPQNRKKNDFQSGWFLSASSRHALFSVDTLCTTSLGGKNEIISTSSSVGMSSILVTLLTCSMACVSSV